MGSAGSEFDHVVVGAGSAGCAIARRLVDAGRSVALVEAGGRDDNPAIHDPGRAWELWNSEVDYAYTTEPQVHAAGTTVFWPRGKVLGGSGSLNGMIYVRGHHVDYDNWAHNGAAGWSYDEVLPYFRRSEDFEDGASQYHGAGGPLTTIVDSAVAFVPRSELVSYVRRTEGLALCGRGAACPG